MNEETLERYRRHDGFFKEAFSNAEVSVAFFREHLPREVVKEIDFGTMRQESTEFINADLSHLRADLLYSVEIGGVESRLYLLFEHQSEVEKWMRLRLLGYECEIWREYLRKNPGSETLPPIVGLVLNQGPGKWEISTEFADLFGEGVNRIPGLGDYLPKCRHLLMDLAIHEPLEEEREVVLATVLELMKRIKERDVLRFLERCLGNLEELVDREGLEGLLEGIFVYCYQGESAVDYDKIRDNLEKKASGKLKEKMRTIAEQLINQGVEQGIDLGLRRGIDLGVKQGIDLGRIESLREDVMEAIAIRFGDVPRVISERLGEISDKARLKELHRAAIREERLEDFERLLS